MFLGILEFTVKKTKKEKFRENCFVNVVSDLWDNSMCVYGTTFRKKCTQKSAKKNNKKTWKLSQSLADSGEKTSSSSRFLRPHYQNSFS